MVKLGKETHYNGKLKLKINCQPWKMLCLY